MIPYEELVAALQSWRSRQGLPTDSTDYLGGTGAADYSLMDAAVAHEAPDAPDVIEEISEFDVAEEAEADGYAEQGYGDQGSAYDDQGDAVDYQQADLEAMRAEYASDAFGDEQETAYSPVQSDAQVEEQALDYGADYDDDGGATVIGDEAAPAAAGYGDGYGMDAPVGGDELNIESFAPVEQPDDESADDDLPTGYGEASLGADPAAGDEALPAYEAASDYGDIGTVDVDMEIGADDVIESTLPPPPPGGGFAAAADDDDGDDDQATAIAAPVEPPPLAPPPEDESSASVEVDALDVIDEDDDPDRAH